jgi:hypothetical protein
MSEDVPKPVEAPLGFVKGGTGTAASEKLFEERFHDAEERRDQADAERQEAADAQTVTVPSLDGAPEHDVLMPGHQGGAVMYTSKMTAHPEVPEAYVLLKYLSRTGSETGIECKSEIIVGADPENPLDLCLILVCPRCQANSHKHQQDNQLRIFQSNKHFELVAGKGPPEFVFEGRMYKSAGVITESEPFTCPDCTWRARIENNCVRPD